MPSWGLCVACSSSRIRSRCSCRRRQVDSQAPSLDEARPPNQLLPRSASSRLLFPCPSAFVFSRKNDSWIWISAPRRRAYDEINYVEAGLRALVRVLVVGHSSWLLLLSGLELQILSREWLRTWHWRHIRIELHWLLLGHMLALRVMLEMLLGDVVQGWLPMLHLLKMTTRNILAHLVDGEHLCCRRRCLL